MKKIEFFNICNNKSLKKILTIILTLSLILGIFIPTINSENIKPINKLKLQTIQSTNDLLKIEEEILWWNTSWIFRKKIEISNDKVVGDLHDFPALIRIDEDKDLADNAQSNGSDLVFTDENGRKLNHEIEKYNETNGELVSFVQIPNLSSISPTILYLYYGNPTANNQQNMEATWDDNFKGVWHLNEQTGPLFDSTINNFDGLQSGGVTYNENGKINGALEFDGISGTINSTLYPDNSKRTLEGWIKFFDFPLGTQDVSMGCNDIDNHRFYIGYDENAFIYGIGNSYRNTLNLSGVSEDEWVYLVLTGDQSTARFYVNGIEKSNTTYSQIGESTDAFHIGSRTYGGDTTNFINGMIDEVRISYTDRSYQWIATTYNNQRDPMSFYKIEEQIEYSENPIIINPYPKNGSIGLDYDPILSVDIEDFQGDLLNITFSTNLTGSWIDVFTYSNQENGRFEYIPNNMNQNGTTYFWQVNVSDGTYETNKLFMFTTKSDWWNNNWKYRKLITIDHTKLNSNISDFPILVDFFDEDLIDIVQTNGDDIVFTSISGNKLSHEIESYDNGHLVAWVKVPEVSIQYDTGFYIYYANPSCETQENTDDVWDSNYIGIWHLNGQTSTTVYDSTINSNDGTKKSETEPSLSEGIASGGQSYDGSDDYIEVGSSTLPTGSKTINTWLKLPSVGSDPGGSSEDYFIYSKSGTSFLFYYNDGLEIKILGTGGGFIYPYSLDDNLWHNIVFTRNSNIAKLYIDGEKVKSISDAGDSISTGVEYIGGETSNVRGWLGDLDEFRISNIARSSEWIETHYNLIKNKEYIIQIGNEEICQNFIGKPFIFNPYPKNQAENIPLNPTLSIDVIDFEGDEMTILFMTNATGSWEIIRTFIGGNDTYLQPTLTMFESGHLYYWRVCVIDPLGSNNWTNETFSFTTVAGLPVILEAFPNNEEAVYNPIISIKVIDYQDDPLTVIFRTNASGNWETLGEYSGGNGFYTQRTSNMDIKEETYFWSANISSDNIWVNTTYSFTALPFVLKWTYATGASTTIGPLAIDVDDDGIYEIFATGDDKITCVNGSSGELIWSYSHGGISSHSPFEIHDLNNDGIEEVVIAAGSRTIALHADDGSLYWNVAAESAEKHLVIGDIEGNGYPYVYICSTDIFHGENGTGRLRKLRGTDGEVLAEVFAWRPCWGGLSLADVDNDGNFELFMTDRSVYYAPPSLGKGMQCYNADNLSLIWNDDQITCSSHCMAIIDVNGDEVLDAVAMQQGASGLYTVDGLTGEKIPGKWGDDLEIYSHSQFSIHDVDLDGNLEVVTCNGGPAYVWDIGRWDLDTTLDSFGEPPKMADVIGDDKLEIIGASSSIKIYNDSYNLIETIGTSSIASTLVQDIDYDGQNELILISGSGTLKVYDTSAYAPTPRVRTNSLYYSERNTGAGIYIPPPGAPQPILKDEYPINGSDTVDINPELSIHVVDFHYDIMNISISTNASGEWIDVATFSNVKNGIYNYTPLNMNQINTTYYWRVIASDPYADNLTTNKTYSFTTYSPPSFKEGWKYRRRITIDPSQLSSDLKEFPLLIEIIDINLTTKTNESGDDFLFTESNGLTELEYEIEYYDNTTGHLISWVKTNLSNSRNNVIYLYYGNNYKKSKMQLIDIWNSNYVMVHHFNETSGSHIDSTSNNNDATLVDVVKQGIAEGIINGADELNGASSSKIIVPDSNSLDINNSITISAWIYPETWSGNGMGRIVDKTLGTAYGFFIWNSGGGKLSFYWYDGTTTHQVSSPDESISLNKWQHVVVTYDRSQVKFYINGETKGIFSQTSPIAINDQDLWIGNRESDGQRGYDGILDELHISNKSLSYEWILTEYENQLDPFNFSKIWDEEIGPIDNYPPVANFTYEPTNPSIDDMIYFNSTSYDTDGTIVNWTWDLDDGNYSYGEKITYKYDNSGKYFVVLTIIDNEGETNSITKNFTVIKINYPPYANDDYITVDEDSQENEIDVLKNDTDPNPEDILEINNVAFPSYGSVSYTAEYIYYSPDLNYYGFDSFNYTIIDNYGETSNATVYIVIEPQNDPPEVFDIPGETISEGGSFATITLDDYVEDVEDPDEDISWGYSGNVELSVSIVDRVATITPPSLDWNGQETILFTATDTGGLFDSDDALFTVTGENDYPVVGDIPGETISEGGSFATIALDDYVEDTEDPDEDIVWTYSGNMDLIVDITDRVATISTPDSNWFGFETITFTATDTGGLSDFDDATFTVNPVNDPPIVGDIPNQRIAEGETFATIALDDYVEDVEDSDEDISWGYSGNVELSVDITNRVATITIPSPTWNGSEIITFTATDTGLLSDSDDATFTVVAGVLPTKVIIQTSKDIVGPGEEFSVDVFIDQGEPIMGAAFYLSFDETLINADLLEWGDLFAGYPTFESKGIIDNDIGLISQVFQLIKGPESVDESGILCRIAFTSLDNSGISNLDLSNVFVTNASAEYTSIELFNGTIQVDATSPVIVDNSPIEGYTGDAFIFNVSVTDNVNDADELAVMVDWSHGIKFDNNTMTHVGGNFFEFTIILEDDTSDLTYTIYAVDNSGNSITTSSENVRVVDNDDPIITGVSGDVSVGTGDSVKLWVSATDNIDVAGVEISIDSSAYMSMTWSGPFSRWEYSYTAPSDDDIDHTYNIRVSDDVPNSITTAEYDIIVFDDDKPEITDNTPSNGESGHTFKFDALVTDNIGVSNVYVYYWFDSETAKNYSMSKVGSTDYYEYEIIIPSGSTDTLHYNISAKDASNNWIETGQKDVTISDGDGPQIANIDIITSEPLDTDPMFGWINISCDVTDNIGVDEVKIDITGPGSYDENVSMNNIVSTNQYYYNTTFTAHGEYTYFIWADDTSDNSAVSSEFDFLMPPNWDIDMDGDCDLEDLSQVSIKYEHTGPNGWIREDVDNDGVVGLSDLCKVSLHYEETWGTISCSISSSLSKGIGSTIMSIQPSLQEVDPGEEFTVDVYIKPGEPVMGAAFYLSYDKNLVHANSITEGDLLEGSWSTMFDDGDIDNENGIISSVFGLIIGDHEVTSEGVFCTISFTALENDGVTNLNLYEVGVTNDDAQYVTDLTTEDGSVTVGESHNNAPNAPKIRCVSKGNLVYKFYITLLDLDDDEIYLWIEWGDGIKEKWIGPFESGEIAEVTHQYPESGDFTVNVKAKDTMGKESQFTTYELTTPSKWTSIFIQFLQKLIERFPVLETMLERIGFIL